MTKPFTRRKRFLSRSSEKGRLSGFSRGATGADAPFLALEYLDQVSCFESLRAYGGRLFHAREHLARLGESCRSVGRELPDSPERFLEWVERSLKESRFDNALVRVSVHWNNSTGEVLAVIRPFVSYGAHIYRQGVSVRTCVNRRWTLKAQSPQIKSSQYAGGVLAHLDAPAGVPAWEIIFLSQDQLVAEGSVSNLFIVDREKTLLTPPASSGILRGVTRGFVLDLAALLGVDAAERPLTRHDVYTAAECFVTNTSSEVLPVVRFDGRKIGPGEPGPVTKEILRAFRKVTRGK